MTTRAADHALPDPPDTVPLPCDRCTAVEPLWRRGLQFLCRACRDGVDAGGEQQRRRPRRTLAVARAAGRWVD